RPTPAETCPERWPTNVIRAPFVFVLPRGLSVPDESLFGFFSALFRPAARPSDPLPTWGRPPSAVRAERSSASESRYSLAPAPLYPCPRGDGRPRPSGRSAAPLPKHDIRSPAPRFTHAHVGTAALGRPAERSSASESRYSLAPALLYLCPRGDGRPRPSGRSAAPLPKHDIRSP